MSVHDNASAVARFIGSMASRQLPPTVADAARRCLADWLAVGLGAFDQEAGCIARQIAQSWKSDGRSPIFFGGLHSPLASALANGTFAHCLDFDDTHVGCLAHLSGPTWAAALAIASDSGADDHAALNAFVAGFEVGARLGSGGFGRTVNEHGTHSTSVFGKFGATTAAGSLLKLNEEGIINALGAAATQGGGLVASFGTMSKPFHAGKSAMDGVLAAQLAAQGFVARPDLLEATAGGLASVLVQDGSGTIGDLDFDAGWEILENTFKPYAACLLTHPAIDSARALAERVDGRAVAAVRVRVSPIVMKFAAKTAPTSPLEAKFSAAYCTALGLCGYAADSRDFSPARLADGRLRDITEKVELVPDDSLAATAAAVTVAFDDGGTATAETPLGSGNPGNPMGWAGIRNKFMSLAEPAIGDDAAEAFDLILNFGSGHTLPRIVEIVSRKRNAR